MQKKDQQDAINMDSKSTAFNDPRLILGDTGDVYYTKLRCGGMETGIPGFGPIFTQRKAGYWSIICGGLFLSPTGKLGRKKKLRGESSVLIPDSDDYSMVGETFPRASRSFFASRC